MTTARGNYEKEKKTKRKKIGNDKKKINNNDTISLNYSKYIQDLAVNHDPIRMIYDLFYFHLLSESTSEDYIFFRRKLAFAS